MVSCAAGTPLPASWTGGDVEATLTGSTAGSGAFLDSLTGSPAPPVVDEGACLSDDAWTAATGRRALELLPQRAFWLAKGTALSVADVAGHLHHRVAGGRGWAEEACR